MKRLLALTALVLASGALAQTPGVYVLASPRSAFLLQWTEAGGQLTGSYQSVRINDATIPDLAVVNGAFTGTRQGTNVNLLFRGSVFGIAGGEVINATVANTGLTLNLPSTSGGFTKVVLSRGSLDSFTKAVNTVRATLAQERTRALAAQAARREEEERQRQAALARAVAQQTQRDRDNAVATARASIAQLDATLKAVAPLQKSVQDVRTYSSSAMSQLQTEVATYKRTFDAFRSCSDAAAYRDTNFDRIGDIYLKAQSENALEVEQLLQEASRLLGNLGFSRIQIDQAWTDVQAVYRGATLPADISSSVQSARSKLDAAVRALQATEADLRGYAQNSSRRAAQAKALFDVVDPDALPANCN